MAYGVRDVNTQLTEEVLAFCKHVVGPCEIVAACTRTDFASLASGAKSVLQVLIVVRDFQPRLMNYAKVLNNTSLSVLAIDAWVFERDVDRGFLGEALASALIFPYTALINADYLFREEIKLKKRLIVELLESFTLSFPELCDRLRIRPEYFLYETMLSRARLFPPTLYAFANLVAAKDGRENMRRVLDGFVEALKQLQRSGIVCEENGYWMISKQLAEGSRRVRLRFTNLFKTGQRAMFAGLIGIFPQILEAFSQNREKLLGLQRSLDELRTKFAAEDPESYVYVPTSTGLAPLASGMKIEAFAKKALLLDSDAHLKITSIGGILNDVYLIESYRKGKPTKAIVKQFRDWSNFKWFPLSLWSVGTRTFVVSGIARLERECAINSFLDSKGFSVPRLLSVSPSQRLIVMEYVEGDGLTKMVRLAVSSENKRETEKALSVVAEVGRTLARVHFLGVALGDTKPENIFVGEKCDIYLMDFEQASRRGDIVWDIAEFLYYSGHEVSPFVEVERLKKFAQTFIRGYLEAGGKVDAIRRAGGPKYTKVFSVFTYPHISYALSTVCRKAEKIEV